MNLQNDKIGKKIAICKRKQFHSTFSVVKTEEYVNCDEIKFENGIKVENEELPEEDPLEGLGENCYGASMKLERDETSTSGIKQEEEETDVKIEVNDDFNDKYGCVNESTDDVQQNAAGQSHGL